MVQHLSLYIEIRMSDVALLENTPDFAALYSAPTTSAPNIARARINRDASVEINDKMESVPAPSIGLKDTDDQEYFSDEGYLRIYLDSMQTAVFDSDLAEYTNMSKHFNRFNDTALDWQGGD